MKKLLIVLAMLFCALQSAYAQEMLGSTLLQRAMYGTEPGIRGFRFTGQNDGITTTFETIWPDSTVYTFLDANMSSPTLSSNSVNDTIAGTGARTVRVTCIDENYVETVADYEMDGQTGVPLTQACMVVNRLEVLTAGTDQTNAGIVYVGTGAITGGVPAVIHQIIAAGLSVDSSAFYGVPAGHKLLCTNFYAYKYSTSAAAQEIVYDYSENGGPIIRRSLTGGHNTTQILANDFINVFNEKTRMQFLVRSSAGSGPFMFMSNCMLINSSANRQF